MALWGGIGMSGIGNVEVVGRDGVGNANNISFCLHHHVLSQNTLDSCRIFKKELEKMKFSKWNSKK